MELRMLVFLFCLSFLVAAQENQACLEPERLALLELKEFLTENDERDLLPSWNNIDPGSECCNWERVVCDNITNHVIELSLDNIKPLSTDTTQYISKPKWFLNISMFHPFNELLLLNLSNNGITDWTHIEGGGSLLTLTNLETLDLSWNYFEESIIPSLKGLSSLENLNLAGNRIRQLKGFEYFSKLKHLDISFNRISRIFFTFLCKLSSLRYLDISSNNYAGQFPFHDISCLSNLKVLKLSSNHINGTLFIQNRTTLPNLQVLELDDNSLDDISTELGVLTSLKTLSLSGNELNNSVIPALCALIQFKRLEELNIGGNFFSAIPQCFYNLSSLKLLDLSQNDITGQVPSSWISKLTSLEYIDIGDNNFQGLFSFSTFNNHSQLEQVRIGSNIDSFKVETEDSNWSPKFQLRGLVLSKCNLNMFSNKVPEFLLQQHELRQVDLSHNNLQGKLPGWLLTNNSQMVTLRLSNNSFTGELYVPLYPMVNLAAVDISNNQIQGNLPENLGNIFPNLQLFRSAGNALGGNLPSSVGLVRDLQTLDLSFNNFKGEVPKTLLNCTGLIVLKLANNEFCKEFFSTHYNLRALQFLKLNDNKFTGSMSNVEVNSRKLFLFDMSNNFMSGKVPTWIARTELAILNLRNNSLEGELPCAGFPAIYVDLSQNLLSGTIPSCSTMKNLIAFHLQSNNFSGLIPKVLLNSPRLSLLNLRDNRFSGNIPDTIGELSNLRVLLLGANQLSGSISKNLCLLMNLTLLDLSSNSFSGPIPSCLSNINFREIDDQSAFGNEISIHNRNLYSGHGYLSKTTLFFGTSTNPSNHTLNPLVLETAQIPLRFKPVGLMKIIFTDMTEEFMKDIEVLTQIDFITKNRYNTYKGDIRNFVSGLDLSSNNLVGEIPPGLGSLSQIHAINMSHNLLTGSIPTTFANLTQVESLDLSHNNLSGTIPSQLTQLTFLGVFSVAYNNLSGTIPYGKAQFGTFENSSFEGNPLLCGPPLKKRCSGGGYNESTPVVVPSLSNNDDDGKWLDIDLAVFFASFSASFAIFFLGVVAFLYINPHWREWLFNYSFYYFARVSLFFSGLRRCNC